MKNAPKHAGTLVAATLYVLIGLFLVELLSIHDYEWMLDDPALGDEKLARCALPPPIDDASDVGILVSALLVVLGLAAAWVDKRKRLRASFLAGVALVAAWAAYRFYFQMRLC